MCGRRRLPAGSGAISPAIQPKPGVTRCSRPRAAISCMPTQMPRNGAPALDADVHGFGQAVDGGEAGGAVGKGALAGQDDSLGPRHHLRVGP